MTIKIIFRNLIQHPLGTLLSLLLLTCGTGIISMLLMTQHQLETKLDNDLRDIDMVVGAKGSPLQLVLSSIYQVDAPVGNIPLKDAEQLSQHPMVKQAIPLAFGDSYQSFRIVGTDSNYLSKYDCHFAQGHIFQQKMDAVIGYQVAQVTGLQPGDTFTGMHGLGHSEHAHEAFKYRVTGILAANNTVVDNLVLTNIASVWQIHDEHEREITALLIKYRSPLAMISLPRLINSSSTMQAAIPQLEIKRLFNLMGIGVKTLQTVAGAIVVLSALSVFIALYTKLNERRYELALARAMGSSRIRLAVFLLAEGLIMVLIGFITGLLLSRTGLWLLDQYAGAKYHISIFSIGLLPEEYYLLIATILLGILAAAIPAIKAFHLNISKTLSTI